MKTSKILKKAAKVIEHQGWMQGNYCNFDIRLAQIENVQADGPVCALGAINKVLFGTPMPTFSDMTPDSWKDRRLAREALERQINPGGGLSIPNWNDTKGRTKDEVIVALLTAAAAAE